MESNLTPVTALLERRKTKDRFTFAQWCDFLDSAALTCGWKYRISAATGEDCWVEYYNDGYTPMEALTEDCSYA
jgi:hypothetical protein